MRCLSIFFLSLYVAGCCHRCDENTVTRYHEDGRAKPIAALPMMIDTTSFDASWSISEEFTSSIAAALNQEGKIFVQSHDDFAIASTPFFDDLSWVKREFSSQEFTVFLELVEHELAPASKTPSGQEVANNLNMGVRIRILDLRGSDPKIVLQEKISDSYYIPKTLFPIDYNKVGWGTEEYKNSPLGIAHSRLVKEIAARVSEYILLAKSR